MPPKEVEAAHEWPQVGDEVEFPSGKGVIIVSKPDEQGIVIVESLDEVFGGVYKRVSITAIKKPKTPEEELRDDIELIIKESLDEDCSPSSNAEYITSEILDQYNITKKQ